MLPRDDWRSFPSKNGDSLSNWKPVSLKCDQDSASRASVTSKTPHLFNFLVSFATPQLQLSHEAVVVTLPQIREHFEAAIKYCLQVKYNLRYSISVQELLRRL